jgi:predicted lactoylglutathione lyase
MKRQIFVNLPVSNLKRAMNFYAAIGFENNPQFTDDTAACMVVSEEIFVMLLTHEKFLEFTHKDIADTQKTAAVINFLSASSNEEVDEFMAKALAAGGSEPQEAKDFGFMYQRSLADPDGNLWEVGHMDMAQFPKE